MTVAQSNSALSWQERQFSVGAGLDAEVRPTRMAGTSAVTMATLNIVRRKTLMLLVASPRAHIPRSSHPALTLR
ncbi:hypothetical protein ACIHDR_01385 [Nocardia sp. NPDC052278]|uniref:hypothetical protein n=1 Tax=unclassified Nocardia TaxID=2637762 RepID=UPI0036B59CD1